MLQGIVHLKVGEKTAEQEIIEKKRQVSRLIFTCPSSSFVIYDIT